MSTRYRRIAPLYDLVDLPFEWLRYRRLRRELCTGLCGHVLEAGVGTGQNLAFYPQGCTVTAVDLSPAMLVRAEQRARRAPVPVELVAGDLGDTGFAGDAFDAVVGSFVLLVMPPEQRVRVLREMARVCRPDGEIRLLEYTGSRRPWRRALTRLWQPWARWAFGADLTMDLDPILACAPLTVLSDRYLVSDTIRLVTLRPR
ncbi:class I SAM-dependent methyltransferase [Aquisalimonas asiatica]|uniref:Methyltransferase domain-containing protein n=1 Tax=Aquisalimonas asiatica TaxID=406100 RepID=A0A1H8SW46_9GAMM|nr:class I SAM-dependent methyltransferase [Aquisalimonas asiatica]SEO82980.1 Methyltransferase domain-containing protein [Aquisalimonas asiatica]